jgi:hypothetical protein
VAAAKLAAQAAWVAAARGAQAAARGSKPTQQQWAVGEYADRVAALKTASTKVVYPKATEELARESLSLLGIKPHGPDPQHLAAVAWQLLLDLGAEQLHAPLPVLRMGLSMGSFTAAVEKEAEVRGGDARACCACLGRAAWWCLEQHKRVEWCWLFCLRRAVQGVAPGLQCCLKRARQLPVLHMPSSRFAAKAASTFAEGWGQHGSSAAWVWVLSGQHHAVILLNA